MHSLPGSQHHLRLALSQTGLSFLGGVFPLGFPTCICETFCVGGVRRIGELSFEVVALDEGWRSCRRGRGRGGGTCGGLSALGVCTRYVVARVERKVSRRRLREPSPNAHETRG